ncbi:MAG: hypothetical protein ACI9OJ_003725, partial [Myxococcota bacterium]
MGPESEIPPESDVTPSGPSLQRSPFPVGFPVRKRLWERLGLTASPDRNDCLRRLVVRASRRLGLPDLSAPDLIAIALLQDAQRALVASYETENPGALAGAVAKLETAGSLLTNAGNDLATHYST